MLKTLAAAVLIGLVSLSAEAAPVTLTFDDIPGGSIQNNFGDMPVYKGFTFNSTLDWVDLVGSPSWSFGAHSGDFGIINNLGGEGLVQEADGSDFTFGGLWAKKWATAPQSGGADSLFGSIAGFNNGALVWRVNTSLNGSYEFYGPQAGLIDQLFFDFGNIFQVDDLTLDADPVPVDTAVPEPASLVLLGGGLAGAVLKARRPTRKV